MARQADLSRTLLKKPLRLQPGDTVALIAPAGPPAPAKIDAALEGIRRFGFVPRLGNAARERRGYFAGSDEARAADIMAAVRDPGVRGIFCLRGGYGSARTLSRLDFKEIRREAKLLVGFSDVTALQLAMLKSAGLVTFQGPMAVALAEAGTPEAARQALLRAITVSEPVGAVSATGVPLPIGLAPGRVTASLVGGNLAIICSLLSTPWQPSFRGRIMFFEDVGEAPYRIDRMLTTLKLAGILEECAGIAVGMCSDCEEKDPPPGERRQTLAEVFEDVLGGLGIPVVTGLPFGHVPLNLTLPQAVQATLDGSAGTLVIEESGVRG